jgi:hypothetical protein
VLNKLLIDPPIYPKIDQWNIGQNKEYGFSGLFYKSKDGTICRRILDIKKTLCEKNTPDLMVIMMNPGGSHPINVDTYENIKDEDLNVFVPTCPDLTQSKVIEFMNSKKFNKTYYYARVINLTDICENDSKSFVFINRKDGNLPCYSKDKIESNSIFISNPNIEKNFEKKTDLLIAWGVKPVFLKIIFESLKFILNSKELQIGKVFGYRKNKTGLFFYHPLVRASINLQNNGWMAGLSEIKKEELLTQLN